MVEEYITFETAKLAKEKGFNYDSLNYYNEFKVRVSANWVASYEPKIYYSIPNQSLLQKWLREEHNLYVEVNSIWDYDDKVNKVIGYKYQIYNIKPSFSFSWYWKNIICPDVTSFNYEEILEAGLLKALQTIKPIV